jgi:hydroxymethylpyrimidine/phosphomethylpyrimidine kinase
MVSKILIIAGSDPSGGAGIQADIKVASAHEVYACAAITCLTAQNTQKVFAVENPSIQFLRQEIEAVLNDVKVDAIKIGMLGTAEIIETVADILSQKANAKIPLILDPVMVATSGDLLLQKDAVQALRKFISAAEIVTPNIDEAEILAEIKIKNLADMKLAAIKIQSLGCKAVLVKGGHLKFPDGKIHSILLDENEELHQITNRTIGKKNIHGTGCALSSALTCNLAKGMKLKKAVQKANSYVVSEIKKSLKVGCGSLVLKHF